jgi:hypothetical protein
MPTTINYKPGLDLPRGRPVSAAGNLNITANFLNFAYDMRGRNYAHPIAITPVSTTYLSGYNRQNDAWFRYSAQTVIGAGSYNGASNSSANVLAPSQGPSGTLTTGNTTTSVVISTALPGSVRANQLANRGDGLGYIIRIIGNSAGGSGKTEERRIVGNTSGTTPTIQLSEALSFTPASGDRYEILSGRLYMLAAGSVTAGSWRFYDLATQSVSANLSNTNQPSLGGSLGQTSPMIALDEAYVPYNRNPGEGFLVGAATYDASVTGWSKGCLTATASAAGTITGQASSGDASVLANEYRNFQIRIVEDTATPTAVGQRRRITSHTAGASAVYTLASNWTVTPSATAKFVIENDTDKIILWSSGATPTYNWNITAGTWDTTTWAARTTAQTAGQAHQAFSIVPDGDKNARQSFIYSHRVAGSSVYDIFDIAGGTTGAWTTAVTPTTLAPSLSVGSTTTGAQVPWTQEGRYFYVQTYQNTTAGTFGVITRFDMKNQEFEYYCTEALPVGITTLTGIANGGFASYYLDGTTYVSSVFFVQSRSSSGQLCQYPILS